ncbi:MAG: tRNA epoxyqueuosine(34) reductase QueG [Bacteroidia bacterium]|nr:tRNA epoxyqueuosine(34) reductase QueG [Bacteroidia bacterium]
MQSLAEKHTQIIKRIARELGFDSCGIARAGFLEEDAPKLEAWLKNQMHGKMAYMENHFDLRLDPRLLVPGTKSVVSLAYNYGKKSLTAEENKPRISKYARGRDYHKVLKKKLKIFMERIREEIGDVQGRYFVDSGPLLERSWAVRAGLGWIGKNGNLILKKKGSYYFLCELLLDIELVPDVPVADLCGSCNRCVEACPTDAIVKPGVVDGSRCISYFTIELKEQFPEEYKEKAGAWIFGCDVCQEVCPWNIRFETDSNEKDFESKEYMHWGMEDWEKLSEQEFEEYLSGTALRRPGFTGLKKNIEVVKENMKKGKG